MAVSTRQVTFVIDMEDCGDVAVKIANDDVLHLRQDEDTITLDHSGARLLVDAINELFPDA